jgi:ParB family transcriptional regulator, chromosome partitioning protein
MSAAKKNAFEGLSNVLSFDDMLASTTDAEYIDVDLTQVRVNEQERQEFEDEDNQLSELGASLRKVQLQPIVIRAIEGFTEPYELVAGERRIRAARLEGLPTLRALVLTLTDEEADDARFAENIHRKNLTQLEEARRLQLDVDKLGMKGAMAKRDKSQSWISKRIALLSLPEHASRLVAEQISADPEVITSVATIEKRDPAAAKALVNDLKSTRGKSNAREKVAKVKEEVKPSTKAKKEGKASKADKAPVAPSRSNTEGSLATARDTSHTEPSASTVWPTYGAGVAGATGDTPDADAAENADAIEGDATDGQSHDDHPAPTVFPPRGILTTAYINIFEKGVAPKKALEALADDEREQVEGWLRTFYDAGVQCKNVAHTVAQNMRKGIFGSDNEAWFALAAFLEGVADDTRFELVNILGSAKE